MMDKFRQAVRPIMTLMFGGAFIYMAINKMVSTDVFTGVAILVIKYWFDSREQKPRPSNGQ